MINSATAPRRRHGAVVFSIATAYCLLRDFGSLKPGDSIVQSNADSAIGQAVIALCKLLNIKTINLVEPRPDFEEVADKLSARGGTFVWKNEGSILDRIKRSRGALPRLALDNQGGATLSRMAEALRPDATLVVYGAASSRVDSFPFASFLYKNLELRGFSLARHFAVRKEDLVNIPHVLLPLMEKGTFDIEIAACDGLGEELRDVLAPETVGGMIRIRTQEEALEIAKGYKSLSQENLAPNGPIPAANLS